MEAETHRASEVASTDIEARIEASIAAAWKAQHEAGSTSASSSRRSVTVRGIPRPFFDEQHGEYVLGDGEGENQEQARWLERLGLASKAQELAFCGRLAREMQCESCRKRSKRTFLCGLRFCPRCARKQFAAVFAKYACIDSYIPAELKCRPGWGWKAVSFAFRHGGVMPAPAEIRGMAKTVRHVMEKALRGVKDRVPVKTRKGIRWRKAWVIVRVSEVGFDNVNLHFHLCVFAPWIPQKRLSKLFKEATGGESYRVVIEKAKDFKSALAHALKYTEKLPASRPEMLARLEVAFHGTRRVQTAGLVYGMTLPKFNPCTPQCQCGAFIRPVSGWVPAGLLAHVPELDSSAFKGVRNDSGKSDSGSDPPWQKLYA